MVVTTPQTSPRMLQRLSLPAMLAWAGPSAPLAALALPFYMLAPALYAARPDMSLAGVGAVILAVRIIDAIAELWLGWACDRFRSPIGRRRGMFALALAPAAVGAWCVFNPPVSAGYAWLFVSSLVLALGYTLATLAHTAWGAELAGSYHERTRFAAFREGAAIIGMVLALAPPALTPDMAGAVGIVGVAVAIALPVLGALAIAKAAEPLDATIHRTDWRNGARVLLANAPLRRLLGSWFLNGFANAIPATLFLYFVSDRLGAPHLAGPFLMLYFGCAVVALPVVVRLSRRAGKHRVWRGAMFAACLVFPLAGALGPGDTALFAIICAITGFLLAFDLVLPAAIQADVVDVDLAASGEQRAGLLYAIWGAITKLSLAMATGFAFAALGVAGFQPGGANVGGAGGAALGWLYAWAPIAPKLLAIALMRDFSLDASGGRAKP